MKFFDKKNVVKSKTQVKEDKGAKVIYKGRSKLIIYHLT